MTKRLIAAVVLLCVLLTSIPALALTKEEWNDSCNWVIAYSTTLYSATESSVTSSTDLYEFTPIGSIAAGEKVSIRGTYGSMLQIYYFSGSKRSAWVNESAVVWSGSSGSDNGSGNTGSGSGNSGSGSGNSGSHTTGTDLKPGGSSSSSSGGGSRKPAAVKSNGVWEDLTVTWVQVDEEQNETRTKVILQTLGTAQSVVYDGKKMHTVPTSELEWETEAPDDQRLAVIYAPRTGKCTLRASASSSAKALAQCDAGRIVIVLRVGEVYTRILYNGMEGLVLNSTLQYYGAAAEGDYDVGTLIYKGRTDSSATISIYTEASTSRRIDQYRVGNEIVISGGSGDYTEAEIDGWHGFVKTQYID